MSSEKRNDDNIEGGNESSLNSTSSNSSTFGKLAATFIGLVSAGLFIWDIVSDGMVAAEYFEKDGLFSFGAIQICLMIANWLITTAFSHGKMSPKQCPDNIVDAIRDISLGLGLAPVVFTIQAEAYRWGCSYEDINLDNYEKKAKQKAARSKNNPMEGGDTEANIDGEKELTSDGATPADKVERLKSWSLIYRVPEILIEAFPATALQLYVVGYSNSLNVLQSLSLASSIFTLSKGAGKIAAAVLKLNMKFSESISAAILIPLTLFFTLASIVPISLSASLANLSPPSLMATLAFVLLYKLAFIFGMMLIAKKGYLKFRFFLFFCSLFVCFSGLWLCSAWIVALAQFLSNEDQAMLPNFIWPNPSPVLRGWIVNVTDPSYDVSSYPWHPRACAGNNSIFNSTKDFVSVHNNHLCFTDYAVVVYFVIVTANVSFLVLNTFVVFTFTSMYHVLDGFAANMTKVVLSVMEHLKRKLCRCSKRPDTEKIQKEGRKEKEGKEKKTSGSVSSGQHNPIPSLNV